MKIWNVIAKITKKTVQHSANTTCYAFSYQPKAPKDLKKFKK